MEWFNQVDATYRADLRELYELNFARFDAKLEQRAAMLEATLGQRSVCTSRGDTVVQLGGLRASGPTTGRARQVDNPPATFWLCTSLGATYRVV